MTIETRRFHAYGLKIVKCIEIVYYVSHMTERRNELLV